MNRFFVGLQSPFRNSDFKRNDGASVGPWGLCLNWPKGLPLFLVAPILCKQTATRFADVEEQNSPWQGWKRRGTYCGCQASPRPSPGCSQSGCLGLVGGSVPGPPADTNAVDKIPWGRGWSGAAIPSLGASGSSREAPRHDWKGRLLCAIKPGVPSSLTWEASGGTGTPRVTGGSSEGLQPWAQRPDIQGFGCRDRGQGGRNGVYAAELPGAAPEDIGALSQPPGHLVSLPANDPGLLKGRTLSDRAQAWPRTAAHPASHRQLWAASDAGEGSGGASC